MIIALTGFMGIGKSTIAEKLSQMLLCPHIDLDKHIEYIHNLSVNELFETKGEPYFRKMEEKYLHEILNDNKENLLVLSLGGGALLGEVNQKIIKENTYCIYLRANLSTIIERLKKGKKSRPHIKNITPEDEVERISRLFFAREVGYLKSNSKIVDVDGKSIHHIVDEIIEAI